MEQKLTAVQFCYWLQGFFELKDADGIKTNLSKEQIQLMKTKLNSVFRHEIDPSYGNEEVQHQLNETHSPPTHVSDGWNDDLVRC